MKIFNNVQIPRMIKSIAVVAPLMFVTPVVQAQQLERTEKSDMFVKSTITDVPEAMLESPELTVAGKTVYPAIVIDISENLLYQYDYDGYLKDVYPVATGKKSTPTTPGLRKITHIETYPYKSAPKATKRRQNPDDYGPYILCLGTVDMKTGKVTGTDGQFLHGTNKPNSIGKKVSKGCVRIDNNVIKEFAEYHEPGQYVLIRE